MKRIKPEKQRFRQARARNRKLLKLCKKLRRNPPALLGRQIVVDLMEYKFQQSLQACWNKMDAELLAMCQYPSP